jgi:hypothetical protein
MSVGARSNGMRSILFDEEKLFIKPGAQVT